MLKDLSPKLRSTLISSLAFAAVSAPPLYSVTNSFTGSNGPCPTFLTRFLHTVVFILVNFMIMKNSKSEQLYSDNKYWEWSITGGLLFYLVSDPLLYGFVQSILGNFVQVATGTCPTWAGVGVHSLVYGLGVYGLMSIGSD